LISPLSEKTGENWRKAEKTGGERIFVDFGFTGVHLSFWFYFIRCGRRRKTYGNVFRFRQEKRVFAKRAAQQSNG
jgi:hypothetical protein